MDKEKMKKAIIIGIIVFILPVIILGLLSLITPETIERIPPKPIQSDNSFVSLALRGDHLSLVVDHFIPNVIVAVLYQSVGLVLIGEFIVSTILGFMDEEKTVKQKTKEFFIKLVVVIILFIVSILFAKLIWDWGEVNVYKYVDRYGRF